jgi:hypothetical protein
MRTIIFVKDRSVAYYLKNILEFEFSRDPDSSMM